MRRFWVLFTVLIIAVGGSALALGSGVFTLQPNSAATSPSASAGNSSASPTPTLAGPVPSASPSPSTPPLSGSDYSGPSLVPLSDANGPQTVANLLFGNGGVACGSSHDTYATDCPVTAKFAAKLDAIYKGGAPYEPLCRCNAAWQSVSTSGMQATSDVFSQITVNFSFAKTSETLTLIVARTTSGWLANDTYCAGDSGTTIYQAQPGACTAVG